MVRLKEAAKKFLHPTHRVSSLDKGEKGHRKGEKAHPHPEHPLKDVAEGSTAPSHSLPSQMKECRRRGGSQDLSPRRMYSPAGIRSESRLRRLPAGISLLSH